MTLEIELKLSLAPEHADDVWRSRALTAHLRGKPVRHELFSAYYDTPDFFLRGQGAALRLRREGGQWIQTLKSGGSAIGGLHTRLEAETEVPAQLLSFPALIDAGAAHLVEDDDRRRAITVIFSTELSRTSAVVEPVAGQIIEVSHDRGAVVAGRRREALCEIELELKQGEPSCLFDLAEALATELPVRIDNTSKAERGYRLASGVRSRPVTASMTPLAADLTVDGAFGAIAAACLQQLQANERGMLAGRDPEYLHQARVALRRLRSAFRVFSRSVPREAVAAQLDALRTIARVLGEARDWDVFVGEFLSIALPARPDDAAADAVRRRAVTLRAQARRRVRAMVGSREYTLALLAMARLLFTSDWQLQRPAPYAACAQGSLRSFASQTLERSHRRLRKMALGIDRINPEQRHALRLRVKKLRYAAEFLSPLFSRKASRSYLSRLKALQEVLGGLNDDATAGRLLGALAPAPADTEAQCTLAYLRGYLAARAQGELDKLEDSLQRACDARPFW